MWGCRRHLLSLSGTFSDASVNLDAVSRRILFRGAWYCNYLLIAFMGVQVGIATLRPRYARIKSRAGAAPDSACHGRLVGVFGLGASSMAPTLRSLIKHDRGT